ncbi:acyl-CoA dehydrogenase family protein [Emcibacter sp. SYSU 3D8]|uniref:acyl-CoA dehydrogenase family protein n=1 Tax=Emcibacter sp. SYSU 3D8 TaxID=3133969 RepID=UPI0031FF1A2E
MDLTYTGEDLAFQNEVRAFLKENLSDELKRATDKTTTVFVEKDVAEKWQQKLYEKGWLAYFWPKEYGGTGWTATQRYIFQQECAAAGAPGIIPMGIRYVGPVIFTFGTQAQKDFFLPKILNGEHYWCQGYSEPGAGSDLAGLKTRAVRDGDHYVVNGSKIWTTHAHHADWIFCLVRTDSSGRKQEGITFLLIDLKTPGIKIDPIITMGLDHEVNQVFFDDVRVPLENRVGEENQGWEYAKFLLEFERGGGSSGYLKAALAKLKMVVSSQVDGTQPLARDPHFAAEMAKVEVGVMAQEITELRMMSKLAAGQPPGAESSIMKSTSVDLGQRMSELMIEALDYYATPMPAGGRPLYEINDWLPGPEYAPPAIGTYLNKRASSIFGGSNEVQRDIIAKLVLRL